jgi:predicted metalloendopeptidase
VSQSGLGLPDRDYYFDADKAEKRLKYVEYVETMLYLLGSTESIAPYNNRAACKAAAAAIMAFETSLASEHLTRTAARDPELTYNKMTIPELSALTEPVMTWSRYLVAGANNDNDANRLNWPQYFILVGKRPEALGDVNIASVAATKRVCDLLANVGGLAAALPHYLCFHVLNSYAPHLPAVITEAHFQFHEKELKGTAEMRPR